MKTIQIQNEIIREVLRTDDINILNKILEVLKKAHLDDGKQSSENSEDSFHKVTELKANDQVFHEISKLLDGRI
jgi:hypothetical protein